MLTTSTGIAMGSGARPSGIEAMGGARLEPKETTHHCLPFPAVRPCPSAILQVMNQPVGHLVRHHLDQKFDTILGIQHRVEAKPTATEVRLTRTSAAQIEPHPGPGQVGVDLAAQRIGLLDPLPQGAREIRLSQGGQCFGVRVGQCGMLHE